MHATSFVLQLLALSYAASAGPCRPQSDVSSSLTTEVSSETSSAETTTTEITETPSAETTTTEITETSAADSSTTDTSTAETSTTETSSVEIAETSTTGTSTTEISTTEAPTTTSTTTTSDSTSSSSETLTPSIANYLQNPGFETGVTPWKLAYQNVIAPSIVVDTAQFHSGSQSGHMIYVGPLLYTGFYGLADSASLVAGLTYDASVWIRQSSSCDSFTFACALQDNVVLPDSSVVTPGTSVQDTWVQLKTTCTWTQAQINTGKAGLLVATLCTSLTLWVDDAVITPKLS